MLKYIVFSAALLAGLGYLGYLRFVAPPEPIDQAQFEALYQTQAPAPVTPPRVFHIGHSLVGRNMPAMLAQLTRAGTGEDHRYESQLGWGTFLKAHWEPDVEIKGFELENDHPRYRDAKEALASGDYDTVVLTEAVEIRDSIKYGDSGKYLHTWSEAARAGNPNVRVYFYETWHKLNDPEGWLERLDRDLELYWETEILRRALAHSADPQPIYIIPAGQVMAAFVRELESGPGIGALKSRKDLFIDDIHVNDFGSYLVALTHYSVLSQRSPVGLPHALNGADGQPLDDIGPDAARRLQEIVWDVVRSYPRTGIDPA